MFEQDYIVRMIREMVRAVLKMLFNIDTDTESPAAEMIEEQEVQDTLSQLFEMVDSGKINEAENSVYELTLNNDRVYLKMGLLFYSYLNDKEDDFLSEHDFSREEIKYGLEKLTSRYGIDGIADIFFM